MILCPHLKNVVGVKLVICTLGKSKHLLTVLKLRNLISLQFQLPTGARGFNSINETIPLPPVEVMPPVINAFVDIRGFVHYTLTGKLGGMSVEATFLQQ